MIKKKQGVSATPLAIEKLPRKSAEYEIAVREHRGLVVRVHPSGTQSYVYRYRQDGLLRRVALTATTLADAANEWRAMAAQVKQGHDPAELAKRDKAAKQLKRKADRADPDFKTLAEDYVRLWAKRHKKSWRADELMLQRLVVPKWGLLKAREIQRRDVIDLLDRVAEKTPVRANRLLAVIRKTFSWAVDRDVLQSSPCARLKRPGKEKSRDRVLNDPELKTFWAGLAESGLPGDTQAALKLQLLTGCRIGEIVGATWAEFDLKKAEWLVPGSRAKNKLENLVPLNAEALKVLRALPSSSDWVFPRPGKKSSHLRTDVATHELFAAKFSIKERFTSHDLRRTVATNLARLKVNRQVVDRILNHKDRTIGAVYDRYDYWEEKQSALAAWGNLLAQITADQDRENVVPIRKTAA